MNSEVALGNARSGIVARIAELGMGLPRKAMIAVVLMISLFAFELFNFDTTRFALNNLMGDVRFLGFEWAAILAIAFCSIDFAGLVRLFTPERGGDEPKEVWYLMGAWLLGATMNALMTWWAVSLTLLNHEFGNEVMSREQLLEIVPIFVAVLVWLTRILFIGAFTVTGEHIFDLRSKGQLVPVRTVRQHGVPNRSSANGSANRPVTPAGGRRVDNYQPIRARSGSNRPSSGENPPNGANRSRHSRIRQRPPVPGGLRRAPLNGVQARSRARN